MNKIIIKNSVKEIKKSFRRFLSLLLISLLGVGFFAGVKATSPDMQKTIDAYFDKENLFDIKIVSTLGLTNEDIEAVSKFNEIDEVYGSYSEDVFVNINESDSVFKVIELTDNINNVKITNGNLPQNTNECVVESSLIQENILKINDKITIREDLEEDEDSSFIKHELTIVGTVDSPLFISHDKGTSTLGDGKLEYYIYVPKENVREDYYTEIYAKLKNAKDMDTTSKEYANYVEDLKDKIETIKEERQKARYDYLVSEATIKLNDAQKEFEDKKTDGEKKIADAKKKIKNGEKELLDGTKKLQDAKDEAHIEFSKAEQELVQAGDRLNRAEIELNTKKAEAESSFAEAEDKKQELKNNLLAVQNGISEIENQYSRSCSKFTKSTFTRRASHYSTSYKNSFRTKKDRT